MSLLIFAYYKAPFKFFSSCSMISFGSAFGDYLDDSDKLRRKLEEGKAGY